MSIDLLNKHLLGFNTYNMNVEIHHHSAFQIVFAQDDCFDSIISDVGYKNIYGFIIKPQVEHICSRVKGCLSILNIEPDSDIGIYINEILKKSNDLVVLKKPEEIWAKLQLPVPEQTENTILELISRLSLLNINRNLDPRIIEVLQYVRDNYNRKITSAQLSESVFLSQSRFSALFNKEVGSSISKFLLWYRMRHAITLLLGKPEKSITEIAYETGFYDSANFNRAMYQLIGVKPIVFRKNSNLIQFFA